MKMYQNPELKINSIVANENVAADIAVGDSHIGDNVYIDD